MRVLTEKEIVHFIEKGYVLVKDAFPRPVAEAMVSLFWDHLGLNPDDPSTWTDAYRVIEHNFINEQSAQIWNERSLGALDALLGPNNWDRSRANGTGYVPVNFPDPPSEKENIFQKGMHLDGLHFTPRFTGPDQAIVALPVFTDIAPGGGGTAMRLGSHRFAAARLREIGGPVDRMELQRELRPKFDACPGMEVRGNAGDLILMHGKMFHGGSPNMTDRVRFIGNLCINLLDELNPEKPNTAWTAYETSMFAA